MPPNPTPVFNDEVDFFDSTGVEQKLPLRLVNPEKGVGIAMTLIMQETGVRQVRVQRELNPAGVRVR